MLIMCQYYSKFHVDDLKVLSSDMNVPNEGKEKNRDVSLQHSLLKQGATLHVAVVQDPVME